MTRRNSLKQLLVVLALGFLGSAQAAAPEIKTINPPQPSGTSSQIEVLEFFSYACSHCYSLDPKLRKWEAAQKSDVVVKRVPVSFGRASWAALGRIYTTLEAMKLADKFGPAVFDAIQQGQVKLQDEKTRNEWLVKTGIDVKAFNDTWRSFGVESLSRRYEQLAVSYKIDGVPTLAVNGKFKVVGDDDETLKAVDSLIQKARNGK
ncbi:MAG: thiol:disulfide interchange protein DsbA/DsbL [Uliginosibacterium sp.]|jgi:thiol:disulfide interchange protein DsbA|nr:thiol:disulfide interchange protein DsbA/DsbL [Uliginosibacterium sp.]MBK9615356.1 thiol:disulfide interchange protein DsbA/DsbL [Uliginosibacterium sp.]